LEFYVDMSGVCATIEDGEGEPLVSLVKFMSGTEEMMRKRRAFRFEAHLREVVIMEGNLGGMRPQNLESSLTCQ
jgi:hypothetical protein